MRNFLFNIILLACLGPLAARSAESASETTLQAILLYQRDSGGWPKNVDYSEAFDPKKLLADKKRTDSTFDNGATTEEMRLLAEAFSTTQKPVYREAFLRGLEFCLEAQYENGGWPQRYPDKSGYHGQITFNDGAMIKVMSLLKEIASSPTYGFVDHLLRKRSAVAVEKGIECILRCQIKVNGSPSVWCAQHDRETFVPVKARSYELPSFSGSESVGVVRFLMGIEQPSAQIIESVMGAVHWFRAHEIKGIKVVKQTAPNTPKGYNKIVVKDASAHGLWARFYDLKTAQPIFCSRDGIPQKQLSDISYERRNGYSWYGSAAGSLLKREFPAWQRRVKEL